MKYKTYETSQHYLTSQPQLNRFESIYKKIKRFFIGLFSIFTCTFIIMLAIFVFYFQHLTQESIHMSDNKLRTELLTINGTEDIDYHSKHILYEYSHSQNPLIVGPNEVNHNIIKALTSSEDSLYFKHNGILPKAILRAIGQDIFNMDNSTGGSTITQQLVKNQVLSNEKTYSRKANELILALRGEKVLTKDEILYTYLNIVPFGRDSHGANITGIASASYSVFGKSSANLNVAEAAYLVGMLQSPYFYTPYKIDGTLKNDQQIQIGLNRQHYVLKRMLVEGKIDKKTFTAAEHFDIKAHLITK